jgi:hypothetical protein
MRRASSRFLPPFAPLAGSLLLILAPAIAGHADESAVAAPAATIMVTNCNDSGPGSLRAAVAGAFSGDTIDMSALTCRRINLTGGAITIAQDNLTLVGGGGMMVDANRLGSVFRHSGTGLLRIRGMTIQRGFNQSAAEPNGGCLYSAGRIALSNTLVRWCLVRNTSTLPVGGGIYALGNVSLTDSQVLGSTASNGGGGIFTRGRLTSYRSRICGNYSYYSGGGAWAGMGLEAYNTTFCANGGGAISSSGNTVIANSTISGNKGRGDIVSLYPFSTEEGGGSAMIVNSTISGNFPGYATVLLRDFSNTGIFETSIVNSTIAFNRHSGQLNGDCLARDGTVHLYAIREPTHVESTIIANNTCDGSPYHDIVARFSIAPAVQGANNLITSSNLPLPPDTIDAYPRLAPLANNGGRTETHALLDDSPAIDMGNNAAGLTYDQRGQGFPRVKGPQADIGAYER